VDRIVIFSQPEQNPNMPGILVAILPPDYHGAGAAFMPSMGIAECKREYIDQ